MFCFCDAFLVPQDRFKLWNFVNEPYWTCLECGFLISNCYIVLNIYNDIDRGWSSCQLVGRTLLRCFSIRLWWVCLYILYPHFLLQSFYGVKLRHPKLFPVRLWGYNISRCTKTTITFIIWGDGNWWRVQSCM